MFGSWNPCNGATNFTGNKLVKKGSGQSTGILCSTSGSGIIEVWDTSTDETLNTAIKIIDDITLTAGNPYAIPYAFKQGLYVKKISGTFSATYFWD